MVSGTANSSVKMGNLNSAAVEGGALIHIALECGMFLINQAGSQQAAGRIQFFRVEGLEKQCQVPAV